MWGSEKRVQRASGGKEVDPSHVTHCNDFSIVKKVGDSIVIRVVSRSDEDFALNLR